ncbi:MAG: methionyl-tRNA formyltransferase [Ilumatobacteraceae bacterium]
MSDRGTPPRRLVYLGTPAMAVPPLTALVESGFEVVCVVTRVDKRRGRGGELSPSPVKAEAQRLGLSVVHTVDEAIALAAEHGADLGVVVACGQLSKPYALAALPMVNLHFSLLPRGRGAAPVERALLAGDDRTGVCLMQLEAGLDTGPVHAVEVVDIAPTATGAALRGELVRVGTDLLVRELRAGLAPAVPQTGEPTYAAKLGADDLLLDWSAPAATRDRQIRLGGAWTTWRGRRLKVHEADVVDAGGTGSTVEPDGLVGGLRLVRVQPDGKAVMSWRDVVNGARMTGAEELGT